MMKKSKIIIASILSVFVVALTGVGLWLFMGSESGGSGPNGPGPLTPVDPEVPAVQYTETNLERFASALTDITGGPIEVEGLDATMQTLATLKNDYMYSAGLAFQDAQVASNKFYKVIEFIEGLNGNEAYSGFVGTENEGATIFEALEIDLSEYFDIETIKDEINTNGVDGTVDYVLQCIATFVTDMKGSSLTQGSSAGKLRQLIDLFKTETGLTAEEFGEVSYHLLDRLFESIQKKETEVNNMLALELRKQVISSENEDYYKTLIEVTATSWVASSITPMRNLLQEIGKEDFSEAVVGMIQSFAGTMNGLSKTNLNTLNQALVSITESIVNAEDDQKEAAYEGAINSLTGLAASKAADMRANRVLQSDGTYTAFYVAGPIKDLLTSLENKIIPIVVLASGSNLSYMTPFVVLASGSNLSYMTPFLSGGSILNALQALVDGVNNGILNILDLISDDNFARQLIETFVGRADDLEGRTFDLSTVDGVNGAITAINTRVGQNVIEDRVSTKSDITDEIKGQIYTQISNIAGLGPIAEYFGIVLENVNEVVIPKASEDGDILFLFKMIAAFLGKVDDQILITRDAGDAEDNVYVTLKEKGLSGTLAEDFFRLGTDIYVAIGGLSINQVYDYYRSATFVRTGTGASEKNYLTFAMDYGARSYTDSYDINNDESIGTFGGYNSSESSFQFQYYEPYRFTAYSICYVNNSDELTKISFTREQYNALMAKFGMNGQNGDSVNPYCLQLESAYIAEASDSVDFVLSEVYLQAQYHDSGYYQNGSWVSVDSYNKYFLLDKDGNIAVTIGDLFAQFMYGVFHEDKITAADWEAANRSYEYNQYKNYSVEQLYNLYNTDRSTAESLISAARELFRNYREIGDNYYYSSQYNFSGILNTLQAYNNIVAPDKGYDRIELMKASASHDVTGESVQFKVVDFAAYEEGRIGVALASEELHEAVDDVVQYVDIVLDAIAGIGREVPFNEVSGTTTTEIGDDDDFTLVEEFNNSLFKSLRVMMLDNMDITTEEYEAMSSSEKAELDQQLRDGYDESIGSTVESLIEPVKLYVGTAFYLFELPQEANDGNVRLTQLLATGLKALIPIIGQILPFK